MAINRNPNQAKRSPQYIQNASYDEDFDVLAVETLEYDPISNTLKRKTTVSGGAFGTNNIDEASSTITYVGSEDADGTWLIKKIDESSGVSITWATQTNNSGVTNYSDAWSGRGSLNYSLYSEVL